MAGDYLLDANIVVAYLNRDVNVVDRVVRAESVFVSATVLGELYYGAAHSRRPQENTDRIDRMFRWAIFLECDEPTSRIYGELKNELRRKGRMIPDNDIWIASSARQHGVTLVSRDGHFNAIDGLDCEAW